MYSLPDLEPVHCSMSGCNCCFLSCIQVSQEAGKVPWNSHLFQNFPQFVAIHIGKGFSTNNEAEVDDFLEFSCCFYDPIDFGNLISGSSAFLNPPWMPGNSWFIYCWSIAWQILIIALLACEIVSLASFIYLQGLTQCCHHHWLLQQCQCCWPSWYLLLNSSYTNTSVNNMALETQPSKEIVQN